MNALGKFLRIDRVQLAMPKRGEDSARSFYRDVLGMKEIPKPEPLAERVGCWFASGKAHVHLGCEGELSPCEKSASGPGRWGFERNPREMRKAGVASKMDAEIDGRRRVHVFDSFGNRLELIEVKSA